MDFVPLSPSAEFEGASLPNGGVAVENRPAEKTNAHDRITVQSTAAVLKITTSRVFIHALLPPNLLLDCKLAIYPGRGFDTSILSDW
jgi:hypothetical protein